MPIMLSGYLPEQKMQGVTDLFDGQMQAHAKRKRPTDILVIGLLRRHKVTTEEDSDKEATIQMKWVALEPAVGDNADELRKVLEDLRDQRTGNMALPLGDEPAPAEG